MFGARKQIRGQLEDLEMPEKDLAPASKYLAELMFCNFKKMFFSARSIQVWSI